MLKVSKAEGLLSTGQKDAHCWHFLNIKPPLSQPPIHFVAFANWSNWWQLNEQSWWYTRNCLTNRNSKRAAIVLVTTNQTVHYLIKKTDHDYFVLIFTMTLIFYYDHWDYHPHDCLYHHWTEGGEGWKVISTCQCTSSLFSSTLPSSSTLTSVPPPWWYECKTVLSSKRLLLSQIYLWHFSGLWLVSCKRLSSGTYI